LKQKKLLEKQKSAVKEPKTKMPKEALEYITELEMELDRSKNQLEDMKRQNGGLSKQLKVYEEQFHNVDLHRKLQEVMAENDDLKIKIYELNTISSINKAYEKKLEELIEYKNRFTELEAENEEFRKQIFDLEMKTGPRSPEYRYQNLYTSTKEELQMTKDTLISTEFQLKKIKSDLHDHKSEIERLNKNMDKKDDLIKNLNFQLDKLKQIEICESLHDSGLLGENFGNEQRIKQLEQQLDELKAENDNYANNEIVRLENMLEEHKEKSIKSDKEKSYFEERCNILEKQNKELKNRIQNLQLGSIIKLLTFRHDHKQKQTTRS
jgi:chromosome segregation ATPase